MTLILGLDPGSTWSAVVALDTAGPIDGINAPGSIEDWRYLENPAMGEWLRTTPHRGRAVLAVEMMAPRGMPTSLEEMQTLRWLGRFDRDWSGPSVDVTRMQEKMHLCGQARAKDANVRQALIDLWGGSAALAKRKECKRKRHVEACCGGRLVLQEAGALSMMSGDLWAALAVAVTAASRV